MKRINYRDYENIITEAVMNVIDGRYNKPLVTEGLGGGVLGILAFFLALFGIPLLTSSKSTTSSASTTATTDNSAQQTSQQSTKQSEQTLTQQTSNSNDSELEALAKKLGLVDVMTMYAGQNIKFDPQYAKSLKQYGGQTFYSQAPKAAYLNKTMAKKLGNALKALKNKGYGIVILDAARPESLQKALNDAARKTDGDKFDQAYIAKGHSRHNDGKAIDCTLYNIKTGQTVDMGGEFDERSSVSHTFYYKGKNKTYHNNRMILYKAMRAAGMINYEKEWWHYSIR